MFCKIWNHWTLSGLHLFIQQTFVEGYRYITKESVSDEYYKKFKVSQNGNIGVLPATKKGKEHPQQKEQKHERAKK